ncbi:MAG: hypothetical protein ACOYMS_03030 [Terrimicrobiaceae bacterium]
MKILPQIRFAGFGLSLLLAACSAPEQKPNTGSPSASWRISPQAAGPLRLGMTAVEAAAALGSSYRVTNPLAQPFVIIDAQFVVWDGAGEKLMEFLMTDALQPSRPGNTIGTIMARSPRLATAEGVAPGMTIKAAAAIYGAAMLRKSAEEGFGGEWVSFARAPSGLRFSVSGPGGGQAGLYEPSTFQSANHVEGAVIHAIEIGRPFLN